MAGFPALLSFAINGVSPIYDIVPGLRPELNSPMSKHANENHQ
jgi:hypothetical protein